MKWENRNVNVEEHANSPQFKKQDDAGAPLRLSESFFVDVLVDVMCWQHQELYSHSEKADIVLKFLMKHFGYSQVCFSLEGAICFQTVKYIGRRALNFCQSNVSFNAIFQSILRNPHHCCNKQLYK